MKKRYLPLLLLAAFAGCVWARETATEQKATIQMTDQISTPVSEEQGKIVDISTTLGDIKVKLYDDTPLHRDNFLKLAREGFYDGVLFHRVINDFMVQTGDPKSKEPGAENLGSGDPGYTIPAEIVYPKHYHKYGALAAARTGDQVNPERRSSGSQFYIVTGKKISPAQMQVMEQRASHGERQKHFMQLCKENAAAIDSLRKSGMNDELEALRQELIKQTEEAVPAMSFPEQMKQDYTTIGGTPHLDGQYTVFGEVLEGMDVVEKIQKSETGRNDRPVEDIKIIRMTVED